MRRRQVVAHANPLVRVQDPYSKPRRVAQPVRHSTNRNLMLRRSRETWSGWSRSCRRSSSEAHTRGRSLWYSERSRMALATRQPNSNPMSRYERRVSKHQLHVRTRKKMGGTRLQTSHKRSFCISERDSRRPTHWRPIERSGERDGVGKTTAPNATSELGWEGASAGWCRCRCQ